MTTLQYLIAILLSLLPYRLLVFFFKKALGIEKVSNPIRFYFSGRVALYRLALACKTENTVALIPDYICNVVHRAFQEAGMDVLIYPTNEYFEPSIEAIQKLRQGKSSVLLCLAPIMGADGGQSWIFSPKGQRWRSQNNITLFMDLSQGIQRMPHCYYKTLGRQFILMASFNDKAFPGVMGAVVISDINDPSFKAATHSEQLAIGKHLLKKIVRPLLKKMRKPAPPIPSIDIQSPKELVSFEYSYCQQFPYTFAHSGATQLQITMAIAGLWFNRYYQWLKKQYLKRGYITPLETPFYFSAPYILAKSATQQLKKKAAYARNDGPAISERPHTPSYHFKGFDDTP